MSKARGSKCFHQSHTKVPYKYFLLYIKLYIGIVILFGDTVFYVNKYVGKISYLSLIETALNGLIHQTHKNDTFM